MTRAIDTGKLSKNFGRKRALDSVDLVVEEGSVFGFLGLNGAGKTTMLRLLTGLARPSGGSIRILGSDLAAAGNRIRAQVGYLPDVPGFYDWMTAPEFLRFAGGLFGIPHTTLGPRVEMLLNLAGLSDVRGVIGSYSRGMRQRLGVAQALINAPSLLLLDEPTSALDPVGRKAVLDMLLELRGKTTVFFSTHILADVDRVCDTVAILDHGKIVASAPMNELKTRYAVRKVLVNITDDGTAVAREIQARPWATWVRREHDGALEINVTDMAAAEHEIPAIVAAHHAGLARLEAGEMGLEDVFVELVGGTRIG